MTFFDIAGHAFEQLPITTRRKEPSPLGDGLSWENILLVQQCNPEQHLDAMKLLRMYLGFDPKAEASYPKLPLLQTLIAEYKNNRLDAAILDREARLMAREVRSNFMRQYEWLFKPTYDNQDFRIYETYLPEVAQKAKLRLIDIHGYESGVQNTLYPELIIRYVVAQENYHEEMLPVSDEEIAMSMIWYREDFRKNLSVPDADQGHLRGAEALLHLNLLPFEFIEKT